MRCSFRFAPFGNNVLLTNDAGKYAFLTPEEFRLFVSDQMDQNSETWRMLCERHFATEGTRETYLQQARQAVVGNHAYLFRGTSLFILALTNRCNNRCVYCQAHGCAKPADMTPETARTIIDRIAETNANGFTIEFQGGEPLENMPAMRAVVDQAKKALADREYEMCLVSNLALMTDEIAEFLSENHISVSTSLDGPKDLHDLNRPQAGGKGSYDAMLRGREILMRHGVSVGAIQTTTRASLSRAREIVDCYADLGMDSLFLRPLTRLGAAGQAWDSIGYTPDEFLAFYREGFSRIMELNRMGRKFAEAHASIFLAKLLGDVAPNYMELRSPCGAGVGQMAFTASGDVYTCDEGRMMAEMGDESFQLGNIYENGYDSWIESPACRATCSASLLETLPTCCDCVYQPYCGVCPVVNYAMEGSLFASAPNNDRCRIYRGMIDNLMEYLQRNNEEEMRILKSWL